MAAALIRIFHSDLLTVYLCILCPDIQNPDQNLVLCRAEFSGHTDGSLGDTFPKSFALGVKGTLRSTAQL